MCCRCVPVRRCRQIDSDRRWASSCAGGLRGVNLIFVALSFWSSSSYTKLQRRRSTLISCIYRRNYSPRERRRAEPGGEGGAAFNFPIVEQRQTVEAKTKKKLLPLILIVLEAIICDTKHIMRHLRVYHGRLGFFPLIVGFPSSI